MKTNNFFIYYNLYCHLQVEYVHSVLWSDIRYMSFGKVITDKLIVIILVQVI